MNRSGFSRDGSTTISVAPLRPELLFIDLRGTPILNVLQRSERDHRAQCGNDSYSIPSVESDSG